MVPKGNPRRTVLALGFALALAAAAEPAAGATAFRVVVNAANPVNEMHRAEVADLFLKERTRWQDGDRVRPVDLLEGSEVRDAFSVAVLRRRTVEIEDHWQKMVFSGRDIPPPKKSSEEEVVMYVMRNAGGIGYVSAGRPLPPGVKPLRITD